MLLFIIALPGRFGDWCEAVAARLLHGTAPQAEIIAADTLAQLATGLLQTGRLQAVVGSRQPDGAIRNALSAAKRRFVVAFDDPRIACQELLADGQDLGNAVRMIATSCAVVEAFAAAPGSMLLRRDAASRDPIAVAGGIARHFGLSVAANDIAAAVGHVAASGLTIEPCAVERAWAGIPPQARDVATGALAPYLGGDRGDQLPSFTWRRDLFFLGDGSSDPVGSAIDITGRARCLLNGPHIALPAGRWSLSLALRVSREAAEHMLFVQLFAERQLASVTVLPDDEGRVLQSLDFVIGEGAGHPVELRVSTCRAAFDGAITFDGASVAPLAHHVDTSHQRRPPDAS